MSSPPSNPCSTIAEFGTPDLHPIHQLKIPGCWLACGVVEGSLAAIPKLRVHMTRLLGRQETSRLREAALICIDLAGPFPASKMK